MLICLASAVAGEVSVFGRMCLWRCYTVSLVLCNYVSQLFVTWQLYGKTVRTIIMKLSEYTCY